MKKIKLMIAGLLILPFFSLAAGQVLVPEVGAQVRDGVDTAQGDGVPDELDGEDGVVTQIINVFLYIIGIISVIMLIFGGFLYITSAGNPEKVKNAKNTIMYAIIGLIIAIFAYAIINWVVTQTEGAAVLPPFFL